MSDALRGRSSETLVQDERIVSLLKDYYRSRRMTIIGSAASLIALFKLALLTVLGFPERLFPLVLLVGGLLFCGFFALIWGTTKWNNSSSELKALGLSPRKRRTLLEAEGKHLSVATPQNTIYDYSTDSISAPASVTEQTTHILDDSKSGSSAENQASDKNATAI